MTKRNVLFVLFVLFAVSCGYQKKIKTTLHNVKFYGATALVQIDKETHNFLISKEGAEIVCKKIADEKEADIKAGIYTKDDLKEDCFKELSRVNDKFNDAVRAAKETFHVLEDTIDIWDSADEKNKWKIAGSALAAADDIIDFLEEIGVPAPKEFFEYADYLKMLSDTLKDIGD